MTKEKVDVLVVGGGPAGATAARRLTEAGLEVLLVEKDLSHKKPCGGGMPSALFKEFQLPENINFRRVQSIALISPSGRRLDIELKGGELRIVDRMDFDRMLRGIASEQGCSVTEGVLVGIQSGKTIKASIACGDGRVDVQARYLIAADGVNSTVRRLLGLKPVNYVYTITKTVDVGEVNCCEFWFGKDHAPMTYSWIFPTASGASMGTGTTNPKTAKDCLRRFLKRLNNDFTIGSGKVRGYRIPLWDGRLYRLRNILFVGDAAGQVMPLTFEGIYYAMKSGEFAAQSIIDGRLARYERLWKGRFLSRFRFMRLLQSYFLKSDEHAERLVNIFSSPEIQELCMRLWLSKEQGRGILISFIKQFRKFIN